MTHKQLASRVKVWAPIVRSHETLQEANSATSSSLQAREEELKQLRMELKVEREVQLICQAILRSFQKKSNRFDISVLMQDFVRLYNWS